MSRTTIDIKITDNAIVFESDMISLFYVSDLIDELTVSPMKTINPDNMTLVLLASASVNSSFFNIITKLGITHDVTVWVKVTKND